MLSPDEFKRYERQLLINSIGSEGQAKLKRARLLVAGVGGLGCPLLVLLSSAGIGTLRLVDDGLVEPTNLNRQFLFYESDVGSEKAPTAAARLADITRHSKSEPHSAIVEDASALKLAEGCDAIVDALDNLQARHALNRASLKLKLPLFHASVESLEARVAVFVPGRTACLRCLYPHDIHCTKIPVLGATAAMATGLQAQEIVKYLTTGASSLEGRLLRYDGARSAFDSSEIARVPACPDCSAVK